MSLLKLGLYVAAGVGTYEILRRTGALQKAGQWLSEQVPDEYKDQAREYVDQARSRAQELGGQVRDRAQQYGDRAQQAVGQATDAVKGATGYGGQPAAAAGASTTGGNGNGSSGGGSTPTPGHQTITGPGRGTQQSVDEFDGGHVSHTVGRGVVR